MPRLEIVLGTQAPLLTPVPPGWDLPSDAAVRRLSPSDASLHLAAVESGGAGGLRWEGDHGDEAVYVTAGAVEVQVGSRTEVIAAGGAVIVESGVAAEVRTRGPARLLHMAPADPEPPRGGPFGPADPHAHVVHAVGPAGVHARSDPGRDTRFYADSSCPTCRITVLLTARDDAFVSAPHSHSQDELIHLLSGSITVGRETLVAGDTLFIEADRRYTFTGGEGGFRFLNYRRDASFHSVVRHPPPVLEGGATHGFTAVRDLVDLPAT